MITNEPRQRYRTVTSLDEIEDLLRGKPTVAFDFETSPRMRGAGMNGRHWTHISP